MYRRVHGWDFELEEDTESAMVGMETHNLCKETIIDVQYTTQSV